jgi:hypothetical protein
MCAEQLLLQCQIQPGYMNGWKGLFHVDSLEDLLLSQRTQMVVMFLDLLRRYDKVNATGLGAAAAGSLLSVDHGAQRHVVRIRSGLGTFDAGCALFGLVHLLGSTVGAVELNASKSGLNDDGLRGCLSIVTTYGAPALAQLTSLSINGTAITSKGCHQ